MMEPRSSMVCSFWAKGRCTRLHCPFLHALPPHHARPLVWTRNPSTPSSNHLPTSCGPKKLGTQESVGGGVGKERPLSVPPAATTVSLVASQHEEEPKSSSCECPSSDEVRGETSKPTRFPAASDDHPDDNKALPSPPAAETSAAASSGSPLQREGLSGVAELHGHQKAICGIALPRGNNKLFSASVDGNARMWDGQTGQCILDDNLGADVACLVGEGAWFFAGVLNTVKAWCPEKGAMHSLDGSKSQVVSLAASLDSLFARALDGRMYFWKLNDDATSFQYVGSLDGHKGAITSLVAHGPMVYSGSKDNTIKVWDITTVQCLQTLTNHNDAVMSLIRWNQYLLSSSLDKTIKVWALKESGKLEVVYNHTEEHGVLLLRLMNDMREKPVLLCSSNNSTVKFLDLPSFAERGRIFSSKDIRALEVGPDGLLFTGDDSGSLKVWKWKLC